MGHPAPGLINTVYWLFMLGLSDRLRAWHCVTNVSFGKPILWPREEGLEETMTHWKGRGCKKKKTLFQIGSFSSWSSGSHLHPVRNQSPSSRYICYVERWEHFSHCDWPYRFQNSLRMVILQRVTSCLPNQRSGIHILASDRSIISKTFYWYWII